MMSGPARAESLVGLADPDYGLGSGVDEGRPVPERVRQIVTPTLGMPALVEPNHRFSVLLRTACAPDLVTMQAWAALVRAPEHRTPLDVLGLTPADPQPGMVRLHLRVPAGMASDHYDLVLDDGNCAQDHQPSSLRVHRAGGSFSFAVLADEQVGDPTGLLPGGAQNGTLFPQRGDVDLAARRR